MSKIHPFQTPLNDYTKQQYTQYLQGQLQKLSSFMLYQKKQNQKHNNLVKIIEDQNQKIKMLNDKVLLIELYQNQNIKNHEKLYSSVQKTLLLQKRITKIENQNPIQKADNRSINNIQHYQLNRQLQRELFVQIQNRFDFMNEKLQNQMLHFEKNLLKKISGLLISSESNDFTKKQIKNKVKVKEIMTPMQTNYTENGRSRLQQFDQNEFSRKKESNRTQKRVQSFIKQKLTKIESDVFQKPENFNSNDSVHSSISHSQLYHERQRSPISSYLKRQNDFHTNKQNVDTSNIPVMAKNFYSVLEKESTSISKKKHKKTKSRSRSRSLSNRSIPRSNDSKLNHHNKPLKVKKDLSTLTKGPKSNYKSDTERILRNQKLQNKKTKGNKNQSNKKNLINRDQISSKSKNKRQKSISRMSDVSASQKSVKSHSRQKSLQKNIKEEQKEYLMYCKKFH